MRDDVSDGRLKLVLLRSAECYLDEDDLALELRVTFEEELKCCYFVAHTLER